jgi:hypothetical protein
MAIWNSGDLDVLSGMGNETLTLVAQDIVNRAATRYLQNAPSLDITEKGKRVFADETSN